MTLLAASPDCSSDAALEAGAVDYLVSHGKSGGFGRFVASQPLSLNRGDRVVVATLRGQEIGTVLCPATPGHVQLLANTPPGRLLRRADADDEDALQAAEALSRTIFADSRTLAAHRGFGLEIVDVEVLLDRSCAIIQYLGPTDQTPVALAEAVHEKYGLTALMENLALPVAAPEDDPAGCGKPDCGRIDGHGCTSCETGGCASCGSHQVDIAPYFAHLRTKMDERVRTSLL